MRSSRNDDSTISAKRKAVTTAKLALDDANKQVQLIQDQLEQLPLAKQQLESKILAGSAKLDELNNHDAEHIKELEAEIKPILEWLKARPTHLLKTFPFTPGSGTLQERFDALNIDVEIPPEFLGEYIKDEIDGNGEATKYNKPILMDRPVKVGPYTYEDIAQLRDIAAAKYGQNYVNKNFPKMWFNPYTGQRIESAAEVDEDFLKAIEGFVLIHEVAHHIRDISDRQHEALSAELLEQALAAAQLIGQTAELPEILDKTTQEIADAINVTDNFPNFLHQQCVSVNASPGLMSVPISIADGESGWTLDFSELRNHKRALPAPDPHPKKYSVAQLEQIRTDKINRLRLEKARYIGNAKYNGISYPEPSEFDKDDKEKLEKVIKLIEDEFQPEIDKLRTVELESLKPEQVQKKAVSAHYYNPFKQEARWVRGVKIHQDALNQLDQIIEKLLINAIDGLAAHMQNLEALKEKHTAAIEFQKTDVIYSSELEIKQINLKLDELPKELEETQAQLPALLFNLKLAELKLSKAEEDEKASIDEGLHNGKKSFETIVLEKKYPIKLLPENLPLQIKDLKTKVMTHPVLLDNEYVIDYDDLMQHWETQYSLLGFREHKGKPGINPFTKKPVKSFVYAKKQRNEIKAFIRNIDEFTAVIAQHKAEKAENESDDLKKPQPHDEQLSEKEKVLAYCADVKVLQTKLNSLLETYTYKERFKYSFGFFRTYMPQTFTAGAILSRLEYKH